MMTFTRLPLWTCLLAGAFAANAFGAGEPEFYQDVYPFLKANCISCHNKTTTKAGLNLETPELMIEGGDSGPSLVPGNSKASLIVEASIHTKDLEMPPKNNKTGAVNLTPKEIEILKLWIDQGAKATVQQARQVVWRPMAAKVHPIYAMTMTGDGRYVAAGRSNQIFVYDATTRAPSGQVQDGASAHRAMVNSLAFSPDGEWLASGSFREVKLWKREQAAAVLRPADAALALKISALTPDGRQVVAADEKGTITLLDAATGQALKTIPGVAATPIQQLSVSPDSTKVAVFAKDWSLSVWNLADGKKLHGQDSPDPALETAAQTAKAQHDAAVKVQAAAEVILAAKQAADAASAKVAEARKPTLQVLVWTRDGQALATVWSNQVIRVWPLKAGDPGLGAPISPKGPNVTSIVPGATPDELISTGVDDKLRVWSISLAKNVREIATIPAVSMLASPDGRQVATGGRDGVVRIWDMAGGKSVAELRGSLSLTKRKDQADWIVAQQAVEQSFQTKTADRIDAQTKALTELQSKAKDAIVAMTKKLPDLEKALATAQEGTATAKKGVDDATAALTQTPDGKPTPALENALKAAQEKVLTAQTAQISADAALKAAKSNISDAEEQIKRITDTQTKNAETVAKTRALAEAAKKRQADANVELAAVKTAVNAPAAKPVALAFSQDGLQLAASFDDGTLRTWAIGSAAPTSEEKAAAPHLSLAARADGVFVSCGPNGALTATRPAPRWVLARTLGGDKEPALFADRVNALCFSPDSKILATGGGEPSRSGDLALFEAATGKVTAQWKERHDDCVLSLAFSPDGKSLASGGADKITRIHDVATGKQLSLFEGHTHYVAGVAFRADGRVLATAGSDGVVNSWDLIQGERLKKIVGWSKEVTSLQFIGPTNQIVTSAGDNLIRIVTDDGGQVRAIAQLPDFMQVAASTSSGATIIGGGEDGFLRFWNGADGKEVAAYGNP